MKRSWRTRRLTAAISFVTAMTAVALAQNPDGPAKRRIAVFGSSVANGTGDELGREGYTGRLRELLAPRGWEVLNQSRGGDNTVRIAPRFAPAGAPEPNIRYLTPVQPSYVLIGLSLGNEGIRDAATREGKEKIFSQFAGGMRALVDRSRQQGIVPVVTLCYTRNDFTDVEYEYVRRMNLLLNSWDVPTVNFLGAVDDGHGKWARGFWFDSLHPNAAGHVEITRTIVPTLFDALERGTPMPKRVVSDNFVRLTPGDLRITFSPADPVHPFAFGITVRAQQDGSVAAIAGSRLEIAIEPRRVERGARTIEYESATLTPAGAVTSGIIVNSGRWAYRAADGSLVQSTVRADNAWHQILVSHYTARGETLFFVDGTLAGRAAERLEPSRFTVGGTSGFDARDLLVYRSALNADEAKALHGGGLLQASLEVYSPLDNVRFQPGASVGNLAQSLAKAEIVVGLSQK